MFRALQLASGGAHAARLGLNSTRCFSNVEGPRKTTKDLPSEADVVVVGGGSIGASTTYHLQKRGLNAVLLERDRLTSGTTWHSAGMLWRLRPSDTEIELHTYTREMCKALEEETGEISWHENGGLFIAGNKERLAEYKRLREMGKYYNVESEILSPDEVKRVHPLLRTDDIYGGMYSPTDGTIDPTAIVNAYTKAAKSLGAIVKEGISVSGIDTQDYTTVGGSQMRRVTGVVCSSGHRIKTTRIVNACGAWANTLSEMVGAKIPLRALKHAFVVTEALEGMHSMLPNVRDHDLSIYLKTQGNAMAIGGYEQNPEFWNDVADDFSFGLFELDWDTFAQNLNGHIQRCPAIETSGITSTVCGPESFTPDHKPLVGPQPGVRGFYQACGFNSMGMMLGGGIGRELATWICEGSPSIDLYSFDCSRFHPDVIASAKLVRDRTHESYAKTYSIVFPHDEPLAGRHEGSRRSGMHPLKSCMYQSRHGFERPGWFVPPPIDPILPEYDYYGAYEDGGWRILEGHPDVPKNPANPYLAELEGDLTFGIPKSFDFVAEECRAARHGCIMFDQSYFGKFFLRGPDAAKAVQYICGADMSEKGPGTVTYTPLCNERGGVEADLTVTNLPDGSGYYFAAGGSTVTKDLMWIKNIIDDKKYNAILADSSDEMDMISVQGPHSRSLLQPLITSKDSLNDADLPFSTCKAVEVAGVQALCMRLTFIGELGFEFHLSRKHSREVYDALRRAGDIYEATNGVPIRDGGYRAIDSLSAEKGYRHWHADLTNKDSPLEANIGFTVLKKLKQDSNDPKYNFIGRAALEAQRASGLKRKLVCLTIEGNQEPHILNGFETIWRDGHCIGLVRSTAYGHSIGKTIAYGYVDASIVGTNKITNAWLERGDWQIGDRGARFQATLHLKAPFDPANERIKGNYESGCPQETIVHTA